MVKNKTKSKKQEGPGKDVSLWTNSHKKFRQKINLLKINKDFEGDVYLLRKKWEGLIKEYKDLGDKLIKIAKKSFKKTKTISSLKSEEKTLNIQRAFEKAWKKIEIKAEEKFRKLDEKRKAKLKIEMKNEFERVCGKEESKIASDLLYCFDKNEIKEGKRLSFLTKKEDDSLRSLSHKQIKLLKNDDFLKDTYNLARKYKLYPLSEWGIVLEFIIISNQIIPPPHLLGLSGYLSKDIYLSSPADLNFDLTIENNKDTGEPELFVQVYEDTTLNDIKKHWKLIFLTQKKLREMKRVNKRYYPLKNLEEAKKILFYKKKQIGISYEDPATGKILKPYKETDVDVAEKIYGKDYLNKAKNIKHIKQRYKKRFK